MKMAYNKEKIFDYLDGKLTTFEIKQIEEWCSNPVHEELFYGWLDEWERQRLLYVPDDEMLSEKRGVIFSESDYETQNVYAWKKKDASGWRKYSWKVAAVVAFCMSTGCLVFYENITTRAFIAGEGQTRTVLLPDGSTVALNTNTVLKVPRFGFGRTTREVMLEGEALFSVVSTEDRQRFVVKTANAANIIVLGTEFSVLSRPDSTNVKLNHGKIVLRYKGANAKYNELDMVPGEQVALDASGELLHKEVREEITAPEWAVREFRFEKTTLNEIVKLLYDRYGIGVQLENSQMGFFSLSGTYEARRGEELLETVAEVLNLDIRYKRDKYVLIPKPN